VPAIVFAQAKDSIAAQKDSLHDTVVPVVINKYDAAVRSVLDQNVFLNSRGVPVTIAAKPRATRPNDAVFYLLAGLVFLVGIIKFFFSRYFTNLFRVFFNTSLRQKQLREQLTQAPLPSLLMNILIPKREAGPSRLPQRMTSMISKSANGMGCSKSIFSASKPS